MTRPRRPTKKTARKRRTTNNDFRWFLVTPRSLAAAFRGSWRPFGYPNARKPYSLTVHDGLALFQRPISRVKKGK